MQSFKEAIRQGADGIESDVRLTSDYEIAMLHDNDLELATNGKGKVTSTPYYGGIEQLKTKQKPHLPIPTFRETIDLLMQPSNMHLLFSVDVKEHSHPEILFYQMHKVISSHPDYLKTLAPRLILGIWHAAFIEPAKRILPYCHLHHLGCNTSIARDHFYELDGFNLSYAVLSSPKGQAFLKDAQAAGKKVSVWNLTEHDDYWLEVLQWKLDMCTTDHPGEFHQFREIFQQDASALVRKRPLWKKLYRSWSLKKEAEADVKWHSSIMRDIVHAPMDSTLAVQLLDDARNDTSVDKSMEKFSESRRG